MEVLISDIRQCIEDKIDQGFTKFAIFPFGEIGMRVKEVLNNMFGIQEEYLLDNNLCRYHPKIKALASMEKLDCKDCCVILATNYRGNTYRDLKKSLEQYFFEKNIAELPSMNWGGNGTKIGKYSFGPICRNHELIESIGAFSSFAVGTEVVINHEMQYITTHPIIDSGAILPDFKEYTEFKGSPYYLEGIQPHKDKINRARKIKIGNDVWLGRNVIITNYANIGNGVIAGAGSIITKDVPDYAVVAGVPARIIKYRYMPEQIQALNKIAWWNWEDEDIRERYDDFYLPVDEFIKKYL